MCGLVAIFDKTLGYPGRQLFSNLLYHGVVRGDHSTGVAAIGKKSVEVYKKAVPSYDFLEMNSAANCILHADLGLIGHNRYATVGAKTSKNAHPFQLGAITLVHNGTLTNKSSLVDSKDFDTDSETICWNLAIADDPVQVLEQLEGAYALIWYNEEERCAYIARNDERELYCFVCHKTQNGHPVHILCSEEGMGEWLIGRDKTYDVQSKLLIPSGTLYKMDIDTGSVTKENFEPKKPVRQQYRSGYGGNGTTKLQVIVDWQDEHKIYASTEDGELAVELFKGAQKQLGKVVQDDILEVEVYSRQANPAYAAAHSAKFIGKHSTSGNVLQLGTRCTFCDASFTQADWDHDNWEHDNAGGIRHAVCLH